MKAGQAAMEFLMSYGWAILVVLVAIAALAYFGVINPHRTTPEFCIFFPGLSCDDHKVDPTGINLVITNGMGKDLENFKVTILGTGVCGGESSEPTAFKDGERIIITVTCSSSPDEGERFVRELLIEYREAGSNLDHSRFGDISSEVEP